MQMIIEIWTKQITSQFFVYLKIYFLKEQQKNIWIIFDFELSLSLRHLSLLLVIEPDCFLFVFDVIFYQIIIHETVNQLFKTEITFVGLKVSDVMFSLFEIWLWH